MTDVSEGYAALSESAPAYEEAHSYYEGSVAEVFGSQRVARLLRRQGGKFRTNVIKSVVDARADRLELLGATVPNDDGASKALDAIMVANAIGFESGNVHSRACEFGDAYVMVWQTEEDDEPVINYHSPLGMRVV